MLVRESISFQRGVDPKKALDIGERYLIEKWLKEMESYDTYMADVVINDDLTIDAKIINLEEMNLEKFPEYIQFNNVTGYFSCAHNKLISLRGCPKITRDFYCHDNQLISLRGCPKIITRSLFCYSNKKYFSEEEIKKFCTVGEDIHNYP
jgi:hypothetical protein